MKNTSGKTQSHIEKLIGNPKRIFLIDGLGAFFTAVSLTVIVAGFEPLFGMPRKVVYMLSLAACIYAVYSFCCSFFIRRQWQPYLKAIVIANILYCCVTTGLVLYFYQSLTALGVIYFLVEVIIIACLVRIELMALSTP
jgi:hypothetical protein